jgi:hypothetical protein
VYNSYSVSINWYVKSIVVLHIRHKEMEYKV